MSQSESESRSSIDLSQQQTSFQWKVPSFTSGDLRSLCAGYARVSWPDHLPSDVLKICIQVPFPIHSVEYILSKWFMIYDVQYLDESPLIQNFKTATHGQGFRSNFFSIGDYKFFIDFYPNGFDIASDTLSSDDIYCEFFLNLASISPSIPKITVSYHLHFAELDFHSEPRLTDYHKCEFKEEDIAQPIRRDAVHQINALNTMTFTLYINELVIHHDDNNNTSNLRMESKNIDIDTDLPLISGAYTWICHPTMNRVVDKVYYAESNLFGVDVFKFMMKIYQTNEEDYDLCLCLASLSPAVERLCLVYDILMVAEGQGRKRETLEVHAESTAFTTRSLHCWPRRFLTKRQMTECTRLSFKVSITIIDAFDIDGKLMTNYHQFQNPNLDSRLVLFEWKITDPVVLKSMKCAANGTGFDSAIFDAFGYKWSLQLFPGGYNGDNEESVDLFLYLVSVSPQIACIAINYSMSMKERMVEFSYSELFSKENFLTGWPYNVLQKKDIQHLDSFTFSITLQLLDIYAIDNRPIPYPHATISDQSLSRSQCHSHYESITVTSDNDKIERAKIVDLQSAVDNFEYVWCIDDEDDLKQIREPNSRRGFTSPYFEMYGLKWFLQFFNIERYSKDDQTNDKQSQLYLCCASLPPTISRVSFRYELGLRELGITHSHFEQFTEDDTTIGWSNIKKPLWSDVIVPDRLTFTVRISLIDIYPTEPKPESNFSADLNFFYLSPLECTQCVVHWFVHQELKEMQDSNYSLSTSSIENIIHFVGGMVKEETVPRQLYQWTISDAESVSKLKECPNGSIFRGQMFEMDTFKFLMQICPNGSNPHRIGSFNWYIYAASIPPTVAKLVFDYRFSLKELKAGMDTDCKELRVKSSSWGWGNDILRIEDIQSLDAFHFELEMAIIDVYDHDGRALEHGEWRNITRRKMESDSLSSSSSLDYVLMDDIVWIIEDETMLTKIRRAKTGYFVENEASGNSVFKWRIRFYPAGTTSKFRDQAVMWIELVEMPRNVSGVSVYFELHIKETNTRWTHCSHFRKDHLSQGWETARVTFETICSLERITLRAKMYLVDVYDEDCNVVTQQYKSKLPLLNDDDQFVV